MSRLEEAGRQRPVSFERGTPAGSTRHGDMGMIGRPGTWRVAIFAFTAVLVLSLLLSRSGDFAAVALAYIGAGGIIVSILGWGWSVSR